MKKRTKKVVMTTLLLSSTLLLTACGSKQDAKKENTTNSSSKVTKVVDQSKEVLKKAKAALLNAQKVPNTKNIKSAKEAISKVKDTKEAKKLNDELSGISARVKLEDAARKAVVSYQKDALNEKKHKAAQTAVSKLTSPYNKTLKAELTKKIKDSEAQANKACASQNVSKAQQDTSKKASAKSEENTQTTGDTSSSQSGATADTANVANDGQTAQIPAGGNTSGNGGNNNVSPTPTPAPTPTPVPTPDPTPTPTVHHWGLNYFTPDGEYMDGGLFTSESAANAAGEALKAAGKCSSYGVYQLD